MSYTYGLKLTNGKYYVGKTEDPERRIGQHFTGNGSKWTRLHKPEKIMFVRQSYSPLDENRQTVDLMKKYGASNVRGGSYCRTDVDYQFHEPSPVSTKGSKCFKCKKSGHWASNCPTKLGSENVCFRCGRSGHWASQCYAKTHL